MSEIIFQCDSRATCQYGYAVRLNMKTTNRTVVYTLQSGIVTFLRFEISKKHAEEAGKLAVDFTRALQEILINGFSIKRELSATDKLKQTVYSPMGEKMASWKENIKSVRAMRSAVQSLRAIPIDGVDRDARNLSASLQMYAQIVQRDDTIDRLISEQPDLSAVELIALMEKKGLMELPA